MSLHRGVAEIRFLSFRLVVEVFKGILQAEYLPLEALSQSFQTIRLASSPLKVSCPAELKEQHKPTYLL